MASRWFSARRQEGQCRMRFGLYLHVNTVFCFPNLYGCKTTAWMHVADECVDRTRGNAIFKVLSGQWLEGCMHPHECWMLSCSLVRSCVFLCLRCVAIPCCDLVSAMCFVRIHMHAHSYFASRTHLPVDVSWPSKAAGICNRFCQQATKSCHSTRMVQRWPHVSICNEFNCSAPPGEMSCAPWHWRITGTI